MRRANEIRNTNTPTQLKKQLWGAVELNGYEKVADALIAGAPIDARDLNGYTPLLWAVDHGHSNIAILLLVCGAKTNIQPKYAKTERGVTYYAKSKNDTHVLSALVDLGIEISAA